MWNHRKTAKCGDKSMSVDITSIKKEVHIRMPGTELDMWLQNLKDTISDQDFMILAPHWAKLGEIKELTATWSKNNFTFGHVKERVRVYGWFMVGMVRAYEKYNWSIKGLRYSNQIKG